MENLFHESLYLKGARDMLLRLQDDYDMYLIPAVKLPVKASYKEEMDKNGINVSPYDYFPLNSTKMRKMIGKAFVERLLEDRTQLTYFMQGCSEGFNIVDVERDKKGNVKRLKVELI